MRCHVLRLHGLQEWGVRALRFWPALPQGERPAAAGHVRR